MKIHVHPISVHLPNALFPTASVLIILYLISGNICFEKAVYYSLIFGFIGSPIGMISGLYDWKTKYNGAKVPLFLEKRRLSIILVTIDFILVITRTFVPDIMDSGFIPRWIYIILIFSLSLITGRLGYLGGKLVFK